ncbi:MAG: hypothetical protein KBS76_02340 [Ruminococcus sp.]|nr:hypothetical protein [Candidatus Apopatosoma intestinale]
MNREEILAKSREENKKNEPMEKQVSKESESMGMLIGLLTGIIVVLLNLILGDGNPAVTMATVSVYMPMIAGKYLYRGIRLKDKGNLGIGFFTAAAAVFCIVSFILTMLAH